MGIFHGFIDSKLAFMVIKFWSGELVSVVRKSFIGISCKFDFVVFLGKYSLKTDKISVALMTLASSVQRFSHSKQPIMT